MKGILSSSSDLFSSPVLGSASFSPHKFHLDKKVEAFAAEVSPKHQQIHLSPLSFSLSRLQALSYQFTLSNQPQPQGEVGGAEPFYPGRGRQVTSARIWVTTAHLLRNPCRIPSCQHWRRQRWQRLCGPGVTTWRRTAQSKPCKTTKTTAESGIEAFQIG